MTTLATAPSSVRPTRAAAIVRWRLHPVLRKVLLVTHIASAGSWLGMDLVLGVLAFGALGADRPVAAAYATAMGAFIGWPIVVLAVLTLASGIVLGLGSKYGLIRTWWVLVKLALTLVLLVLVLTLLLPGVAELTATASSGSGFVMDNQLLFPPVVSTSALLFAMILSVAKPWGRVRRVVRATGAA
jgi:hypothetical protein